MATPPLEAEPKDSEEKEHWCQKQGMELAHIFDDKTSLGFYVSVHSEITDLRLLRAIFIQVLDQLMKDKIRKSPGALFTYICRTALGPLKTYDAACAEGVISRRIQDLVKLYEHKSYTQIAESMGALVKKQATQQQTHILECPNECCRLLGICAKTSTPEQIQMVFRAKVKQFADGKGGYVTDMDKLVKAKEEALKFVTKNIKEW